MKLTLSPTGRIDRINDSVEARVWEGTDQYGTRVHVWVVSVSPQTHDENRLALFDAALKQTPEATHTPGTLVIDMRRII